MFHLCNTLAQLTDYQRGEQLGEGISKLIGVGLVIACVVIIWRKSRNRSED